MVNAHAHVLGDLMNFDSVGLVRFGLVSFDDTQIRANIQFNTIALHIQVARGKHLHSAGDTKHILSIKRNSLCCPDDVFAFTASKSQAVNSFFIVAIVADLALYFFFRLLLFDSQCVFFSSFIFDS